MRRTILGQFLVPTLLIVIAAVAAVSLATAYWYAWLTEQRDQRHVAQIVDALTTPGFPLTDSVIRRMSVLSGAQFALVDRRAGVAEASLTLDDDDRARLAAWAGESSAGSEPGPSTLELGDARYLAQAVPVQSTDPTVEPPLLIVLSPQTGGWAYLRRALAPPLVIGALACLVLIATITWRSRQVVRPLLRLKRQTEAIAEGDFRAVELDAGGDEVHQLAVAINVMVARLHEYEQGVRHQERLQTLGQLAGSMAHHLRNAATGGRLALELHGRDCPLGEHQEDLEVARRQLTLMEGHLQRLLLVARAEGTAESAVRESYDLIEVVRRVVELVEPICRHAQIALDVADFDPDLRLIGDARAVEQAITNLAFNAIEAVQGVGVTDATNRRRVAIEITTTDDGLARVTVRDSGPGPSAEMASRLFEPFASDKPSGAGLGLAVVTEVAATQGGRVHWSREGRTTCFVLELPLAAGSGRMLESLDSADVALARPPLD